MAGAARAEDQPPSLSFTHPLLQTMQRYCYECHHAEPGESFDPFSRQPAFFTAASEQEILQNVRLIAGRALRYLRSYRMPKATNPPLHPDQRRALIQAIKSLALATPPGQPSSADPAALARVQEAYARQIRPIVASKCDVCHGQQATWLQRLVFGGGIRLARQAWDSDAGYPFGGDFAPDPVLQLSHLDVAVANRSMPPFAYVATYPSQALSDDEVARIRHWISAARALYTENGRPGGHP